MLEVLGLSVAYGDLRALWDLSFDVREGELVAIIGPNGAGKTTTVKAILGLLRATAGRVVFRGRQIERLPTHARVREGLALVPEGRHLFPFMTVGENLALGALTAHDHRAASLQEVYDLFPVLGERRRQLAGTLSGGEQQMVAIGRALMSRPRLLMLDEPSLGLAPIAIDVLYQRIADLNTQGLTILLVEQYVFGALSLAHRAYVLEVGRIVREGPGRALLADDHIRRAYLAI